MLLCCQDITLRSTGKKGKYGHNEKDRVDVTAPWVNYAPRQLSVVILLLWAFSATIEECRTITVNALLFYCQGLKRTVKGKRADAYGEA